MDEIKSDKMIPLKLNKHITKPLSSAIKAKKDVKW